MNMHMDNPKETNLDGLMEAISRKNGPSKVKEGVDLVDLASDLAKRKLGNVKSIKLKDKF